MTANDVHETQLFSGNSNLVIPFGSLLVMWNQSIWANLGELNLTSLKYPKPEVNELNYYLKRFENQGNNTSLT